MQQDAYIGPKPGTQYNRLFPEYGTNFRYIGKVKHGLDRVTVVTSIPIPRYGDIKKKPLEFNCTIDLSKKEAKTYGSHQYRVHEYRFDWASIPSIPGNLNALIQPGINANGFPPNLIICTCVPGFYWTMAPRPT